MSYNLPNLNEMPPEIKVKIAENLSSPYDLMQLGKTSRSFNDIRQLDLLWKELTLSEYPGARHKPDETWEQTYSRTYDISTVVSAIFNHMEENESTWTTIAEFKFEDIKDVLHILDKPHDKSINRFPSIDFSKILKVRNEPSNYDIRYILKLIPDGFIIQQYSNRIINHARIWSISDDTLVEILADLLEYHVPLYYSDGTPLVHYEGNRILFLPHQKKQ